MSADGQTRELEGGSNVHAEAVSTPKTKNRYNKMEWAGAFGDIGTLIPFVVAYITSTLAIFMFLEFKLLNA